MSTTILNRYAETLQRWFITGAVAFFVYVARDVHSMIKADHEKCIALDEKVAGIRKDTDRNTDWISGLMNRK